MKFMFIVCVILCSIFFMGFIMNNRGSSSVKASASVGEILDKTATVIEKKYKIKTSGSGISMPGGIVKKLALAFTTKNSLSKNDLRKLLIEFGEELLQQINNNKNIQPFLETAPFTIENVQIIIYNHDKDNRNLFDPEISTAELSAGFLTYRTTSPDNPLRFNNEFKETYEEALEALQNQ
mgnify:CR=1 FL=1